jgi:hypothetical protein
MLRRVVPLIAVPGLALIAASSVAGDEGRNRHDLRIFAELKPTEEVPALSSPAASGRFKATIDADNQTISYELSYDGLQAPALQAHIHIGQRRVNGGISVFLCGNPPTQGIDPTSGTVNEFDELVDMLRQEVAYVNVHSSRFPGGEVRGQVRFFRKSH